MTYEDFKQLVYEMRQMQRTWFKTHEQSAIIRSRQLEKRVDDVLESEFSKQPKLW